MSDLSVLVGIRKARERRYAAAVSTVRMRVKTAEQDVETARTAMDDFANEVRTMEFDMLSKIVNSQVTMVDIDAIFARLEDAKAKAIELADRYQTRKSRLSELGDLLEEGEVELAGTRAAKERLDHLNTEMAQVTRRINAQKEDSALDEFRVVPVGQGL